MKPSSEIIPVAVTAAEEEQCLLSETARPAVHGQESCFTLRSIRNRAEVQAIQQALGLAGWNRRRAAELLAISYRSLLLKIQQHKITRQPQ
jgi:DNA-binding NtrC family response regulator